MNIHEISRRSKLSITKLRGLERMGVLKVDDEDNRLPALRLALNRGRLSTAHLVTLIEEPDLIYDLGDYAPRVETQIGALGDTSATPEAKRAAQAVYGAAAGNADDLDTLADWVQARLRQVEGPVNFHYLAVRLALAQFPNLRDETVRRLNLAFAKLRALPRMAGWYKPHGDTIIYRVPAGTLDL